MWYGGSARYAIRGGASVSGSGAGIYAIAFNIPENNPRGFRCVYRP